MSGTYHVVRREWQQVARDGRVLATAVLVALLMAAALVAGLAQSRQWQAETVAAAVTDTNIWNGQGAVNPHNAAHFGQYAFKPSGALAWFDPGVNDYLGRGLWMEAHYQNPASLRPAEEGTSLIRFGTMSGAYVLQIGLPLLILLAGFGSFASERESGTLKLQLAAGASMPRIFFGKALALASLALLAWLPVSMALFYLTDDAWRAATAAFGYALYAFIWVGLTLGVSASVREAKAALALLLVIWLATLLVVPRMAVDVAEKIYPSPNPQTFWADVGEAQKSGIDGHGGKGEREKALLATTLAQYGVSREQDLPISFAGISLQAGEDFGNEVFDRYYGTLWAGYGAQDRVRAALGLISPLLPIQSLSQAAAGTDWRHHRHFADAAEAHRRQLQRFLNGDFTAQAKGRDFDYKADAALWSRAPRWQYERPQLATAQPALGWALGSLFLWALCAWSVAYRQIRVLLRGGAL